MAMLHTQSCQLHRGAQQRAQLDEIGALKARLAAVEAVLPAADAVRPIRAAAAQGY
ncbi:MAG: hypothetical protein HY699_02790 [Deltaproteobacteria bacterium]|nr:hypothetical protein [Deltaproteobacteria bacterium]